MDAKVCFHTGLYLALQHARRRPIGSDIRKLRKWERLEHHAFDLLIHGQLKTMLHYAKKNVPFYSSGAWQKASSADISTWPLLNRNMLVSSMPLLRSRISYPGALRRQSSGTSGPRLQVVYNPQAAAWSWANEYRAMLWHELDPGVDAVMLVHDMFGTKRTSKIQDWIKNKKTFLANCLTRASLDEIAEIIVRRPPTLFWGIPSAAYQVVRHLATLHGGNLPRIPFFKLGGEQVYPFQRREIQERMGGRVFATYGCAEVGAIGAECRYGSLHLFLENAHVEVMKDGIPVPRGEMGELVVTSLANRAMPLIRYVNGDQGRISPERCNCGLPHPVLQDLGRKTREVVDPKGDPIPVSLLESGLDSLFSSFPPPVLRQIAFEQRDQSRWKVYVESPSGINEALKSDLGKMIRNFMGSACEIEIEGVSLVQKEKSGKFCYFRRYFSQPVTGNDCQNEIFPTDIPVEHAQKINN